MDYCLSVKARYPAMFNGTSILDCGSLDINGNNRYLFEWDYNYTGIDVGGGNNVDIVESAHLFHPDREYDVVISTEMLEHNRYWAQSLLNMNELVRSWGIMLITCAWYGRYEHGTTRTSPSDAPFTNDWYENIEARHFSVIDPDKNYSYYEISKLGTDIRFFWIKK